MTYQEFYSLELSQICSILNAYDYSLLGDSANGGNGNGLDRFGRSWLFRRGIRDSGAFENWLKGQRIEDYPAY